MGRQASSPAPPISRRSGWPAGKKSIAELAKELGRSEAYIRCTARPTASAWPCPKLTDEDRGLMRARESGMKLDLIAEKFDCALSTAQSICRGVKERVPA